MEPESSNFIKDFFKWLESNWFQMGIVALVWRSISFIFKYFSEARDENIRRIVKEELRHMNENFNEKFEDFDEKIDKLTALVFERLSK